MAFTTPQLRCHDLQQERHVSEANSTGCAKIIIMPSEAEHKGQMAMGLMPNAQAFFKTDV